MDLNFANKLRSTTSTEFEAGRDYMSTILERADALTAAERLRPEDVIVAAYTLFYCCCEDARYDYIAVEEMLAEMLRQRGPRGAPPALPAPITRPLVDA